jgi:hypothetical protein
MSCSDCAERPVKASGLCSACYQRRWKAGTLPKREKKRDGSPHLCTVHPPSRACYSAHGCRCDACRNCNVEYEAMRTRRTAYGQQTMVDAAPVLEHVRVLSAAGLGKARLSQLTGLSVSTILKLKRESKRVRKETADAIMAVEVWQAERTPEKLAQIGKNQACVVCSDKPLFGGLRCLPCFQRRCRENAGEHLFASPASTSTYQQGCRCRACRAASAAYSRQRRAA